MYPLEGLRMAGVDMTSPEPVEAAFATLASMVDRLEKLAPPMAPATPPHEWGGVSLRPSP